MIFLKTLLTLETSHDFQDSGKNGILAGFVLGLCILLLGFFQTLFLAVCMAAGGYLGKRMDDGDRIFEGFRNFFRRNKE